MKKIYLESINSTNKYAKENITKLDDKTIVYTFNQNDGYGRLNRQWINSPDKNIYISFVLKPFPEPDKKYSNFTQYLSVILSKVFEKYYNLKPEIKWPNDILIKGKKIAGILAESVIIGNECSGLVLGIGVNINSDTDAIKSIDKPATSLFAETNKIIDKDDFLKKLLNEFFLLYDEFIDKGFSFIKNDYTERVSFFNKKISMNVLGTVHTGVALNISDDGSLILLENGKENLYFIGDIL